MRPDWPLIEWLLRRLDELIHHLVVGIEATLLRTSANVADLRGRHDSDLTIAESQCGDVS